MNREADGATLRCSFCRTGQDEVGKLISSPSDYERAYVCDDCVVICERLLKGLNVGELSSRLGSGSTGQVEPRITSESDGDVRCSFCHRRQTAVGSLVVGSAGSARAYICKECIEVCRSILDDDKNPDEKGQQQTKTGDDAEWRKGWHRDAESFGNDVRYLQFLSSEFSRVSERRVRVFNGPTGEPQPVGEYIPLELSDVSAPEAKIRDVAAEVAKAIEDHGVDAARSLDQERALRRAVESLRAESAGRELEQSAEGFPSRGGEFGQGLLLQGFPLVHLRIFQIEKALVKRDFNTALACARDACEPLQKLIDAEVRTALRQLSEQIDVLASSLDVMRVQQLRKERESVSQMDATDPDVARRVGALYADVLALVQKSRTVVKVNVFPHGVRDVFTIDDQMTVADLSEQLKEKYTDLITEYLYRFHRRRVLMGEVKIRIFSDAECSSGGAELGDSMKLVDIPKRQTEGVTWYPELADAPRGFYEKAPS